MPTSITQILEAIGLTDDVTYVKPSEADGTLRCPSKMDEPELCPHTRDHATLRFVCLLQGQAVPIHEHPEIGKFKLYTHYGEGVVCVWLESLSGGFERITLRDRGDQVVIPPGYKHAMLCRHAPEGQRCEVLVTSFSPQAHDTRTKWEPATEELCRNERRELVEA